MQQESMTENFVLHHVKSHGTSKVIQLTNAEKKVVR